MSTSDTSRSAEDAVRALLEAGQLSEAGRRVRQILQEDRTQGQNWVLLGDVLRRQGKPADAWRAYERGWILDPQADWVADIQKLLGGQTGGPVTPWLEQLLEVPDVSITAAIIARNEEASIATTVARVAPAVDEVLVVDTGSEDRTVEEAGRAGARVVTFPWADDFSAARNFGLAQVRSDWVLWVDADEWLYPEDVEVPRWVAGLFQGSGPVVLRIVVMNKVGPALIPFFGGSRMFPTAYGLRWWGLIHEQVGPPEGGPFARTYPRPPVRIRVHHEGYDVPVMEQKQKLARNVRLLRRQLEQRPDDITAMGLLGRELMMSGDMGAAIAVLRRAEALAPQFPSYGGLSDIRKNLTEALLLQNQWSEALEVSRRLVTDDSGFPLAWYVKGKAELALAAVLLGEAQKDFAQCRTAWSAYRGIAILDDAVRDRHSVLGWADALAMSGDWTNAVELYRRVQQQDPSNQMLRDRLTTMKAHADRLAAMNMT